MPTLSSPRFGAVFTLVGNKADFPAAEQALRQKAKEENHPLFIQHSQDLDLSAQAIKESIAQGNAQLKSDLIREDIKASEVNTGRLLLKEFEATSEALERTKTEDLKGVRVYTGKLDTTLGRLAAVFDAPFYALRSLAGSLVQGQKPKTQSLVRKVVNAITSVGYLLATHVLGLVTSLPQLALIVRGVMQVDKDPKQPFYLSFKAVTDDGFKLPR